MFTSSNLRSVSGALTPILVLALGLTNCGSALAAGSSSTAEDLKTNKKIPAEIYTQAAFEAVKQGMDHAKNGENRAALKCFDDAVQLCPKYARAYSNKSS